MDGEGRLQPTNPSGVWWGGGGIAKRLAAGQASLSVGRATAAIQLGTTRIASKRPQFVLRPRRRQEVAICRSPSTAAGTPEALRLRGHPRWDATKGRQSPPQLVQRGAPRLVVTDILLRLPAAIAECELHGQGSTKTKPRLVEQIESDTRKWTMQLSTEPSSGFVHELAGHASRGPTDILWNCPCNIKRPGD